MSTPSGSVLASVFGDRADSVKRYVDILLGRGIEWGVIGPGEAGRLWDRHIFNCAGLADLLPLGASVADVGSGAGLPGIPLAIRRPDLEVVLLEPLLRRANFLTDTVAELGLTNVEVVRGRAEDHRRTYDAVVSRAVAPLPKLLTWCVPLRRVGGDILALKGARADAELAEVEVELARRGLVGTIIEVAAYPGAEPTKVVSIGDR